VVTGWRIIRVGAGVVLLLILFTLLGFGVFLGLGYLLVAV
jgi:hypothetical protein